MAAATAFLLRKKSFSAIGLTWFLRGATVKPILLMRHKLQYLPVALVVRLIGALPRPLARGWGILLGGAVYHLHRRLRRVGMRNLELAFPEKPPKERRQILRGVYVSLGRLLAEACLFPSYTRENVSQVAVYQGFENFEAAEKRGKGVLFLTGHFGGWEIGSFFHSLQGHPMKMVVRPLDNPYVDALVTRYRGLHGNQMIGKDEFARGLLAAMRNNETVGVLMDTNMTPPQGVFVELLRHSRLHRQRRGAGGAAYRSSGGSGVHHLGPGAAQIPRGVRPRGGAGAHRRS